MLSLALTHSMFSSFFFFNDTAPTEIYTLSLHDALPISRAAHGTPAPDAAAARALYFEVLRSEEHTSELQSLTNLVCRLLLEKKKKKDKKKTHTFHIKRKSTIRRRVLQRHSETDPERRPV